MFHGNRGLSVCLIFFLLAVSGIIFSAYKGKRKAEIRLLEKKEQFIEEIRDSNNKKEIEKAEKRFAESMGENSIMVL